MAAIVVSEFRGELPSISARNLPEAYAARAVDCRFENGELLPRRGETLRSAAIHFPTEIDSGNPVMTPGSPPVLDAYENPWASCTAVFADSSEDDVTYYMEASATVSGVLKCVRAPSANDSYNRSYISGFGNYRFVDVDMVGPELELLGVPPPGSAPTLTTNVLGTGTPETRAYVYTFVSKYGEESAPSPPLLIPSTTSDATITLELLLVEANLDNLDAPPGPTPAPGAAPAAGVPDGHFLRLYRTVPGASSAAFFFAGEFELLDLEDPVTAVDSLAPDVVALNETLQSFNWFPPPLDLAGLTAMSNGILAGFRGRDVLFSEPYRPHAWPREYIQSVEDEIVAVEGFEGGLAIMTRGQAYLATGTSPESMLLTKVGPSNPILHARSACAFPGQVLYATRRGIASISASGYRLITQTVFPEGYWQFFKDAWGVRLGDSVYVLLKPKQDAEEGAPEAVYDLMFCNGIMFDFARPDNGITQVRMFGDSFLGAHNTAESDRPLVLRVALVQVDPIPADPEERILVYGVEDAPAGETEGLVYRWRSKEFFFTKPVNFAAFQVDRGDVDLLKGEGTSVESGPRSATANVWADGELLVADAAITPGAPIRIPSTKKAQIWQFELEGNLPIARVVLAETAKELETV